MDVRMSQNDGPRGEYTRRIARWDAAIAAGERRHHLAANLRLLVIGLVGALIWLVWTGRAGAEWFAAPAIAFIALVIWHDQILHGIETSKRARGIYLRGVSRLDGTWAGSGADGARFLTSAIFAPDLDLFGPASLFQLLNTVRTEAGEDVLADWLIHGADPDEIRARQQAVDELRPMIDFREALAVIAAEGRIGKTSALARWALLKDSPSILAIAGFALLSLVSLLLLIAVFAASMPVRGVFLWFFLQVAAASLWARRGGAAYAGVDEAGSDLDLLKTLLQRLESQAFVSPRLAALRNSLPGETGLASRRIAALQRLVTTLQSCANPMVSPFAIYFQVPTLVTMAIAKWRAKHGHAIAGWLRAVGVAEAFAALATYAFENPENPFPAIEAHGPIFDAAALAHPLLHASVAVPNDVRLGGLPSEAAPSGALSAGGDAPHVLMISGSNMSGKSTLLRAVGTNAVLALAGAPVRAARLRLSPVALGVSIRIEDSLQEGQSKFYAEILRLRSIVDLAKGPIPLLFLLDEMLAGTNSYDRRIGAEAIIRSLAAAGAIGLVTTHDLALTELVPALGQPAENVHFEDRIEDGKMAFDYRMRPGVVQRSNALALMRAIGLDV
jgi:hypothetical protein